MERAANSRPDPKDDAVSRRHLLRAAPAVAAFVATGGRFALALPDVAGPTTAPSTGPATQPGRAARKDADRQRVLDYLLKEYDKLLRNADFVRRGMAVVSYARLPDPRSIPVLLDVLNRDTQPVVQMLAWEGLMSRAAWVDAAQHAKWIQGTWKLESKGVFRGRLRVGLFDLLATSAPDKSKAEKLMLEAVLKTNSQIADDVAVLDAAGRCLKAWQHEGIAEKLVAVSGGNNAGARRVLRLLRAAGFSGGGGGGGAGAAKEGGTTKPAAAVADSSIKGYWDGVKASWKLVTSAPAGEPWRKLKGDILATIPRDAVLNPDDPKWTKELELGRPELKNFDVAFVIDVSSSMTPALRWVQREIGGIMEAMQILAREPRIGLTFFSNGEFKFKSYPLTGDLKTIHGTLAKQAIIGGGEELVLDGLKDAMTTNPWPKGDKMVKVLILIADEEIVPNQVAGLKQLVEEGKPKGFRVFSLSPEKIPASVAALTKQAGGASLVMPLPQPTGDPGQPRPALDHPGTALMTEVVSALVSPAFRDRVAPLVAVTLLINAEPFGEFNTTMTR